MKVTLFCLLLLAVGSFSQIILPTEELVLVTPDETLEMDKKAVLEFLGGLAEGFAHGLHFQDFVNCIHDEKEVATHVIAAIKLFQSHKKEDIGKAIAELAKAAAVIPKAVKECKAAVEDIKTLIQMIEEFSNPGYFIWITFKNLIVHGVEIYHHVKDGVSHYKAQEFRQSGLEFGEAIARTFFGSKPASSVAYVNALNAMEGKKSTWKAKHYTKWENLTLWDIKKNWLNLKDLTLEGVPLAEDVVVNDVPDTFDSRKQWPNCGTIGHILDQGKCGSCWAFGASEAVADRFCIHSKGSVNELMSAQYEVSCDTGNMGCNGGWLNVAWKFLENKGIVTEKCWPYVSGDGKVPRCNTFTECDDGSDIKQYFIKKGSTKNFAKPASIQNEIYANGPIETGFSVYQDFMNYESGIYQHESGSLLGGHAVKIIGWGEEGGVEYWLAANSWYNDWGEQGFFRIAFGECGFDKQGIAGMPKL